MHQQNPQETYTEESPFCEATDLKPTTSPTINPQQDISHRAC